MTSRDDERRRAALRDYAAGLIGTRRAMELAGLDDYAELVIALSQSELDLPKPADTPQRRDNIDRARAILQPLLRDAG
jgi:hypothetical protein